MTQKLLSISIIFLCLYSCKKHSTENVVQAAPIDTLAKLLANTWHVNKIGPDSNNNNVVDSGETHIESTAFFTALTFYSNFILTDTVHYVNNHNPNRYGAWYWGKNKSHIYIALDSIDFVEFTVTQITDTNLLLKDIGDNAWWECIPYRR